jgi:hypothetical protein
MRAARLGAQLSLRIAPGLLQRRAALVVAAARRLAACSTRVPCSSSRSRPRTDRLGAACLALPLLALRGQRSRVATAARLRDSMTNLICASSPADLGIGLVQRGPAPVQAVAGSVVGLAHVLQFGFDMAQLGGLLFQIDLRPIRCRGNAFPARPWLRSCATATAVSASLRLVACMSLNLAPPRPALPASRGWRSVRAGYRRRGSDFRACHAGGFRFRGGAPCTSTRRPLLPGRRAALRLRASMMREIMPWPMIA